jgi:hypothetical protein
VHDDVPTPGESTLAKLPFFGEQPFQSGIDVFVPASPDADGTLTARNLPRGDAARPQTLNVPDWPSSGHTVSLGLRRLGGRRGGLTPGPSSLTAGRPPSPWAVGWDAP